MNISTFTTSLNPYMLWIKLGAVLLIVSGIFGSGAYTAHRFDAATIQGMKTDAAKLQAQQAQQDNAALALAMKDAYGQAVKDNALNAASAAQQAGITAGNTAAQVEVRYVKIPTASSGGCSHMGVGWMQYLAEQNNRLRAAAAQAEADAGHGNTGSPGSPSH